MNEPVRWKGSFAVILTLSIFYLEYWDCSMLISLDLRKLVSLLFFGCFFAFAYASSS